MRKSSLKNGFTFFLKANILLVLFILLYIVIMTEWRYDGSISVVMFAVFAEVFIISLSIVACMKPNKSNKRDGNRREQSKECLGAFVAFVLLSLFSLIIVANCFIN